MKGYVKYLFGIVGIVIIIISCENSLLPYDKLKPGSRDYTWEKDTLFVPPDNYFHIRGIWGASPDDIWAVGPAASIKYGVWHYDGISWKVKTPSGMGYITHIYGFSSSDIFAVSFTGNIWHYDGTNWEKQGNFNLSNSDGILWQFVYGKSPTDVWAVGHADKNNGIEGIAMHYNGKYWKYIDTTSFHGISLYQMAYQTVSNTYIFLGEKLWGEDKLYLYKNDKFHEIQLGKVNSVETMNNEIYITKYDEIYKLYGEQPYLWKNLKEFLFGGRIWGRSEKDFFCITYWDYDRDIKGGIAHYNGSDIKVINPTLNSFLNAIVFDNEVFFVGSDDSTGYSMIFHGILN